MASIAIGVIDGGSPSPHYRFHAFIMGVMRHIGSSQIDSDDWSLNVVFVVPGPTGRPDFEGTRAGKFDRSKGRLMVQAAVLDQPFGTWGAMVQFVLEALEEATTTAAEFFSLEGLSICLSDAWGQIGALRQELELKPSWAVDLPTEPVDVLSPEERALVATFERRRAAAAPYVADLRLLSSAEGGRHFPILSGHSCDCYVGEVDEWGKRVLIPVVLYVEENSSVEPGGEVRVRIAPVLNEPLGGAGVGSVVELREGNRLIGEATIVEMT